MVAPEVRIYRETPDAAADVYSVAVLLLMSLVPDKVMKILNDHRTAHSNHGGASTDESVSIAHLIPKSPFFSLARQQALDNMLTDCVACFSSSLHVFMLWFLILLLPNCICWT